MRHLLEKHNYVTIFVDIKKRKSSLLCKVNLTKMLPADKIILFFSKTFCFIILKNQQLIKKAPLKAGLAKFFLAFNYLSATAACAAAKRAIGTRYGEQLT